MTTHIEHASKLATIVHQLHELDDVEEVAAAAVEEGAALLGSGHLNLMLSRHRRLQSDSASDHALATACEAQTDLDQGPAIDVLHGSGADYCPDLTQTGLWPLWAPVAADQGWRSWLSIALVARGRLIGVFNYADTDAGTLSTDQSDLLRELSVHSAVALDSIQTRVNLARAVEARSHVGQAIGVLMERFGITADQAFAILRRYSQDQQRKLHDVATELLDTNELPAPSPTNRSGWTDQPRP
ncbi:GAF and ANTAR domain-containing protein [Kribbella sp. NPDC003557]|uniref:GAF and ANTAR domain-containing protein n=1 Tax=Kribbella sp. NPDC003557 TaxID=3154449 RepID=UPI0033AFBE66